MQREVNNYKQKLTYRDMAGEHIVLIVLGGLNMCRVWEKSKPRVGCRSMKGACMSTAAWNV